MLQNRFVRVVELIRVRRARAASRNQSAGKQVLLWSFYAIGGLGFVAAIFSLAALPFYLAATSNLPPVEQLEDLLDPISGELLQPTRLYDQKGETLLLTLAPAGIMRHFIQASDVPWLAKAYVASNQPNFWMMREPGLGEWKSSPTTIAEHLVDRTLLPSELETWMHNFRVHLLASELVKKYSREQLLTWALNSTDFGHWAFGAESAAQLYFSKQASQLTLAESALLAAVAQAPALNPIDNPDLAIRFQQLVLTSMWEQELISKSELDQAVAEPLTFANSDERIAPSDSFTDLALEQLETDLGSEQVVNGGLLVTTTLDYSLQQEINALLDQKSHQISAIILDPLNDRILATYGGINDHHKMDGFYSPFSYLAAFANGKFPSSLVWDNSHGPINMRMALANHYTGVDATLLADPATEQARDKLLEALGILPIKGEGISLQDAGRAFQIFPLNGLFPRTQSSNALLFVSDQRGRVLLDQTQSEWQSIVSPETSYLVTDILSDKTALPADFFTIRPAAFFTDLENYWWFAYSPQRVIAVWDEEKSLDPDMVQSIFEAAHQALPIKSWNIPPGLTSITVCVPSGQLPDMDCPQTRRDWFLRGSEPTESDSLYSRITINSLNGKLATVFTPQEFIKERVYLIVPPEGELWARGNQITPAPIDYDPIHKVSNDPTSSQILRPTPFSTVKGSISITASLSADIVRYDIQVGEGLFPSQWLQITGGAASQRSSKLAEWDTAGLSGIWAIQLQAWDADGRITRAYTVVTIDSGN